MAQNNQGKVRGENYKFKKKKDVLNLNCELLAYVEIITIKNFAYIPIHIFAK